MIMSRIEIIKRSHSFQVKTNYRGLAATIARFAERFEEREWKKVKGQPATFQLLRSYCVVNAAQNDFTFHINAYNEFIGYLGWSGIDESLYTVEQMPMHKAEKIDIKIVSPYKPMEEQIPLIKYLGEPGKTKILTLQTGKGKFLHVDEPVLTPTGWRPIGEIKNGDVVIAPDGTDTITTGVYPQGKKDLYEFTFYDGRTTIAGLEHQWKVYYVNTSIERRWRIATTEQIIKWMNMPNPRVAIPLIEPFDGFEGENDSHLPMDPYLLGALLGDGCLTKRGNLSFTKQDATLIKEISDKLSVYGCTLRSYDKALKPKNWKIVNLSNDRQGLEKFHKVISDLGLLGCYSWEKFIPKMYLNTSLHAKRELIRGMMDTDGTVGKHTGTLQHCTTSKQMALELQYIIRSVGDICKISEMTKYYDHNGEKKQGRLAYQCNIRAKKPSEYFGLPRKRDLTNDGNQYSSDLKLYIKSVKKVEAGEAVCISVDHPEKLYITRDFIVTHNTYCFLQGFAGIKERCCLILPAKYIQRWVDDLTGDGQVVNLSEDDLWVVKGAADFGRLIQKAKNGEFKAKMVIFSSTTFQLYLKAFRDDPATALKEYGCEPIKLMKLLKVGVLGRDEVHELFHFNFLVDLSVNVPKTISLSATVDFDNKMTNKMCAMMFPKSEQINNGVWDKYIKAVGLFWKLDKPKMMRCTLNGAYNHGAFETSIIKHKPTLERYLDMIQDIVENVYSRFDPGEKVIVFAYTVQMCTLIAKRLEESYENEPTITINRYVGEDEYGDLLTGDIIVSTLKSAGTAVDIKNLASVLMTTAIYSTQSNVQALGRLRKLKNKPNFNPEFYYLVCKDIDKHIDYHKAKVKQFSGKVITHDSQMTQYLV